MFLESKYVGESGVCCVLGNLAFLDFQITQKIEGVLVNEFPILLMTLIIDLNCPS